MNHRRHSEALHAINTRHPDQLLSIAQAFGGQADATAARAERIDADGIDLAVDTPKGPVAARVEFDETVSDFPEGIRVAFVRLARAAANQQS